MFAITHRNTSWKRGITAVVICLAAARVGAEPPSSISEVEKGHSAREVGPAIALEHAAITKGGGVHSDGSIVSIGQAAVGTMSNGDFTIRVGIVPILAPTCQASTAPTAEMIGPDFSTKNRFLSFAAGDPSRTQAVRVTFESLSAPFDLWNGSELWVGPTSQVTEAGANILPTEGFPNFTAATLQCEPFYTDWSLEGTVHVFHEGIVPLGSYGIQVVDEACDASIASSFSQPLLMTTALWGDTLLDLSQTPPLPPGGAVNIDDVLGVLGAFSSVPGAIVKARADLEPACLDLKINVTDVLASLSGFVGLGYPFAQTVADPCDPTCPNPLP